MATQSSSSAASPNRAALLFILLTSFLGSMGIGLITPVAPFLVSRYVTDPNSTGLVLGWLISIYAVCQFIAAPALGVLSDRYGRRPILLICLFGSAVGYLLFGLGGALWVLFLGRIIDGITGANFAVTFAYIADVTPPEQRGRYFGLTGAIVGIGFILGPTIGGFLANYGYTMPLYIAAAITFLNVIYGFLFAPESLPRSARAKHINTAQLNPLSVLAQVSSIRSLRWLLIVTFLYSVPLAAIQANLSLFAKDTLGWDAESVGILFALIGLTDIVTQGVLLGRLLPRLGERRMVVLGLLSELLGYVLLASVLLLHSPIPIVIGTIIFAFGDGLIGPSIGGLLANAADTQNQGQVQGGSQAVQALARILGPILGGVLYDQVGYAIPYLSGAVIVLIAALVMSMMLPHLRTSALAADPQP